jgi:hypothetical protein
MIPRRTLLKATSVAIPLAAPTIIRSAKGAQPFFKLYMMIPNNQPSRMIWGTLCARQIAKLGVEVVPSYVDFNAIVDRRSKANGKTYPEGGWDAYFERYYYDSITPQPNSLFRSDLTPPNGPNYYCVSDPVIDKTLAKYASAIDPTLRMAAIHAFENTRLFGQGGIQRLSNSDRTRVATKNHRRKSHSPSAGELLRVLQRSAHAPCAEQGYSAPSASADSRAYRVRHLARRPPFGWHRHSCTDTPMPDTRSRRPWRWRH